MIRPACMLMVSVAVCLGGCASGPPASTRLTADDFAVTESRIRQDLAASDFLARRGPDSPPMIIVVRDVENATSDVITEAEQWMAVHRVVDSFPVQALRQTKNIRFVLPRERYAMLREEIDAVDAPDTSLNPTHVMDAQFESITRGAAERRKVTDRRTEYYYLAYRIVDLQGREVGWNSSFEFQREASGTIID